MTSPTQGNARKNTAGRVIKRAVSGRRRQWPRVAKSRAKLPPVILNCISGPPAIALRPSVRTRHGLHHGFIRLLLATPRSPADSGNAGTSGGPPARRPDHDYHPDAEHTTVTSGATINLGGTVTLKPPRHPCQTSVNRWDHWWRQGERPIPPKRIPASLSEPRTIPGVLVGNGRTK